MKNYIYNASVEPAPGRSALKRTGLLNDYFIKPYLEAEQIAHAFRMSPAGQRFDGRTVGVCIVAALCLSAIFYLGNVEVLNATLQGLGLNAPARALQSATAQFADQQFAALAWWAAVSMFFFLVVPALVIRCIWGEPLAECRLRLRGAFKDIWLYLLTCAMMVPVVLFVSYAPGFQDRYPFYTVPPGIPLFPRFYEWEAIYLLQFFALVFFFRGFLLHGLKHRFGYSAIFVSMMPYCMLHFSKPLAETLAAIIAGVILGHVRLKSGSILLGALVHCTVALTMDVAALWQKNML